MDAGRGGIPEGLRLTVGLLIVEGLYSWACEKLFGDEDKSVLTFGSATRSNAMTALFLGRGGMKRCAFYSYPYSLEYQRAISSVSNSPSMRPAMCHPG